ncbi:type II secretion system protein GspI [Psychromonas sp. RZ5]|nr:type II secretion system protein GspI [Psychromonas sp. RZ5]
MKSFVGKLMKRKQGMTLLEVMLALVILATSGLAVMQAASQALNNQSYLQQKTFAMWIASNRVAELKLQETWPSLSWKNAEVEFANVKWYWRYQGVATADPNFIALDVEVSDKENGQALAHIRTYIAKP